MSVKIRFGIFIFVCVLIFGVMLYSAEKQKIEALGVSQSDVIIFENQNTYDGANFKTTLSPGEIIKKLEAKIHSKQILKNENLEIYYCFVENVNKFVVENGKKINLQIAYNGSYCIVGFPLILSGY